MRRVVIKCPQTGHMVFTGQSMDDASFQSASFSQETMKACPACGQTHVWSKQDAQLE